MLYRSALRQAARLALLLAGALAAGAVPAAAPDGASVPAPATLPPALMLAQHWQPELEPQDFLVSEKLDGVRAFWDGSTLRFRSGRLIAAPAWFTAALPAIALDGELWLGRGRFDRLSGMVRRAVPIDAEWRELRYMIFDLPGQPGPFSERAARMVSLTAKAQVPWLQVVAQRRVADRAALKRWLAQVVRSRGEGLMLHRADALWQAGRSEALRKLKPLPDEEGRVVAYRPGKGRHLGRMGALVLQMPSGQRFALGTGFSDAQRKTPPPLGAWITYRYRDRTPAGLPRFATFLRVRQPE